MRRRHRLRGRRAFAAVRGHRVSAASGPLRVQAMPGPATHARVGFATPRLTRAVRRNRLRRRVRMLVDAHLERLTGVDIVVTARPEALDLPFDDLGRHLARCLDGVLRQLPGGDGHGARTGEGAVVDDNEQRPAPPPSPRLRVVASLR